MSSTIIYAAKADGKLHAVAQVPNPYQGFLLFWQFMEYTHLPAFQPESHRHMWEHLKEGEIYSRVTHGMVTGDDYWCKPLWDLAHDTDKVSEAQRAVMLASFTGAVLRKPRFQSFLHALRAVHKDMQPPPFAPEVNPNLTMSMPSIVANVEPPEGRWKHCNFGLMAYMLEDVFRNDEVEWIAFTVHSGNTSEWVVMEAEQMRPYCIKEDNLHFYVYDRI